ncbi:MAG: methyltransferase domain-containing protein [Candidatus Omnitrophica bacterium]|nr:methyltransferase domain-containing protein [Candidatus Omnitrophota bacterium]
MIHLFFYDLVAMPGSSLNPQDQLDAALEAVRLGRLAEGEQILKDLSRAAPDFHDSWGHLAHLLVQQGRIEEAVLCYQKVLEIKPGLPEAVLLLGDAFYSLGQHDRAYRTYLQLKGQPVFESKDLQIRLARCEPAWRLFLQRGLRKLPELGRVLVSPGFYCALGRELWLLPRSGSAIRLVGLKAYLAFLYHSLVREKTWHFPLQHCDLCGGNRFEVLFFHRRTKVVRCLSCGLETAERKPPEGQDVFSGFFEREEIIVGLEEEWSDPALIDVRLKSMKGLFRNLDIDFPSAGWKVFEVGCGQGQFLASLVRAGLTGAGIEGSKALADYCVRKYSLDVNATSLKALQPATANYDLVYTFHVIEHLDHPSELFQKAHQLLRPGGYLFIETPTLELDRLPLRNRLDEKTGYANPEHMHFFTHCSLAPYFPRYGFDLVGTYQYLSNGGFLGRKQDGLL